MNYVDSLDINGMNEIMQYLGESTLGLTAEEIYDRLLNRNTGIVYNHIDKILKMDTDQTTPMRVAINKAIHLREIVLVQGVYMFKNNTLGVNIEQILNFFQNDIPLYENGLLPQIANENMPISISNELNQSKSKAAKEKFSKSAEDIEAITSLEELKKIASEMDIAGWQMTKDPNKLRGKILDRINLAAVVADKENDKLEKKEDKRVSNL